MIIKHHKSYYYIFDTISNNKILYNTNNQNIINFLFIHCFDFSLNCVFVSICAYNDGSLFCSILLNKLSVFFNKIEGLSYSAILPFDIYKILSHCKEYSRFCVMKRIVVLINTIRYLFQ